MLDKNSNLKLKLNDLFDRTTRDAIALLIADTEVDEIAPEPTLEWMTASQLARYWQLVNANGEPTTAGIMKWARRSENEHPLPHAYMGDLLRFHRADVDGPVRKPIGDEFRTNSADSGSRKKNHRHETPLDLESSHFDGWDSFSRRENSRMAIYKRYKGRRLKRSDRDWNNATWWIEFSLQGQYIHQAVPGARTQAQAERAENKRREEIYEGKYNPVKKLFSEFVDETFLPWSKANKRSYREDEQRSVTLKDFFGEKHLRDIKPMMIEKFKRERLATPTKHDKEDRPRPRTPASVNRDLACLSKILSMAFDNELIDSNPMRRVRLLKESPSRERFITAEEEKRLFVQLTGRRDHIRSVVTIALNTGMRRGEILGLQWEHVNFLARTVFIAKSKTGRTRMIPMNDIVFKELTALKQDAGPKEFVFSNSRTGVNIDSIKTGWRNACEDAGLVNLRFHDTRHTFATRLRANGVHEWDIRDLLGHASVRMTSVYTHQTPANLCHAVNTLTNAKLGKVVRFPRKKRERSTKQIAPSSRHLAVEQLSSQQPDAVSVRQLAS